MRIAKLFVVIFVAVLIFSGGNETKRYLIKFLPGTSLAARQAFFAKSGIKPVEFDVFGYDIGESDSARKIQAPFIQSYAIENPKTSAMWKGGCLVQLTQELQITKNKNKLIIDWYENILGIRKAHKFLADKKVKLSPIGIVIADNGPILAHPDIAPALKKDKDGRAIMWMRRGNRQNTQDHGTHVACLAAGYHDGKGMEGAAGPSAYILPIILNYKNNGNYFASDVAVGLKYYVELEKKGVVSFHTVNMSFGQFEDTGIIKAAILGLPGKLFVAAGGNEKRRNIDKQPLYPASLNLPNVLAVAATDNDDVLTKGSNVGPERMGIAAPGGNIISCVGKNDYAAWNGTSFAAPLVAGTATLFHSMASALTVADAKNYLFRGADRLKSLEGKVNGARRLNVYKSVQLLWKERVSKYKLAISRKLGDFFNLRYDINRSFGSGRPLTKEAASVAM